MHRFDETRMAVGHSIFACKKEVGDGWEMVRDTGFEPVTPSVSGRCSTTELTALSFPAFAGGRETWVDTDRDAIPFFIFCSLTDNFVERWAKKRREVQGPPAFRKHLKG